jgi:hypothetical protein
MQVQFQWECGQAIRMEQSEGPRSLQCPTCGKMLTVAGSAGPLHSYVAGRAAPQPAAGLSVAAMVFGICGIVPGLGVLAGPVGVVLGIVAMVKKRRGRGLAIAGIATGAASLFTVQVLVGLYIYWMVMMFSAVSGMAGRMAVPPTTMPAMSSVPSTLPAYGGPRAPGVRPVAPPATMPAGPERE